MGNRYVFVENNTSERSNNPEKSWEAFVDAIMTAMAKRVNKMYEEGSIDILQLYSKLDCPPMRMHYDRMEIGRAYKLVELTQQLVAKGVLRLESSSWGSEEMSDEKHIGTQPGLEDMHPDSVGWNNYGGPTYSIKVSKEGIEMQAGISYQDLGGSWDTIDTSLKWQYRTFSFVPTCDDDATLKQMLTPFDSWIIARFIEMVQQELLRDVINRAVDAYLDKFLCCYDAN